MIESQQISTTSTINDYHNLSRKKINIDEEQEKGEVPEWQKCKSKRFRNLVECYLCKVEDCQILFETKEELNEHKKTAHNELYKCDFPNCEKSFMKIINLRNHFKYHFKNIKKGDIFVHMKVVIKALPLHIILLLMIKFIQEILLINAKNVGKNFLIELITNIMLIICIIK